MRNSYIRLVLVLGFVFFMPFFGSAATVKTPIAPVSFSAWLPYWKKTSAVAEATANLNKLNEINPFSYTVDANGGLVDTARLSQDPWTVLLQAARAKKIKIIPTINWTDANAMETIMASSTLRIAHENQIVSLVRSNSFDGIDIDYENKTADTRVNFSKFLKELSAKLIPLKKQLVCSVEARTPLASRFKVIPKTIEYANDFVAINSYCTTVKILAYDQGRIDILLNKSKGAKVFYAPVADTDWVKKVVAEAAKSIAKKKMVLGVATYGYEYEINGTGQLASYRRVRSLNYQDFMALAKSNGAAPVRDYSGELVFSFVPPGASATHFAVFSDSVSIASKIKLARSLGLAGVAIFKIDGGYDTGFWNVIK